MGLLPFRCVANVPRAEWDERRVRDCLVPLDGVRHLGNFPQAFSHLALMEAAARIIVAESLAEAAG